MSSMLHNRHVDRSRFSLGCISITEYPHLLLEYGQLFNYFKRKSLKSVRVPKVNKILASSETERIRVPVANSSGRSI